MRLSHHSFIQSPFAKAFAADLQARRSATLCHRHSGSGGLDYLRRSASACSPTCRRLMEEAVALEAVSPSRLQPPRS